MVAHEVMMLPQPYFHLTQSPHRGLDLLKTYLIFSRSDTSEDPVP